MYVCVPICRKSEHSLVYDRVIAIDVQLRKHTQQTYSTTILHATRHHHKPNDHDYYDMNSDTRVQYKVQYVSLCVQVKHFCFFTVLRADLESLDHQIISVGRWTL